MSKNIPDQDAKLKLSKRECDQIISQKYGSVFMTKAKAKAAGMEWPLQRGWKRLLAGRILGREVVPPVQAKKKPKPQQASKCFYSSWGWKQARYEALKRYHNRCQCCGWQPGDTAHGHLVVDHIKPRRKFPELELDPDNLQVLCNDCNMGKGANHMDDWRAMDEAYKATVWN